MECESLPSLSYWRRTPSKNPWVTGTQNRVPWLTIAGTVFAVALWAVPGSTSLLCYDTRATHSWTHAVTSHWVHWNGEHFFWSAAAFLVIGALCESHERRAFAACIAMCAIAAPVAVRLGAPHLTSYAGLSGMDFGLYTLFCVLLIQQNVGLRRWAYVSVAGLLFASAIAKVAYELFTGTVLFVSASTAMAPAPVAHVAAACVGIAIGLTCPKPNYESVSEASASPDMRST
jgi:rhomboid family GlyGly-CTERM serine protease